MKNTILLISALAFALAAPFHAGAQTKCATAVKSSKGSKATACAIGNACKAPTISIRTIPGRPIPGKPMAGRPSLEKIAKMRTMMRGLASKKPAPSCCPKTGCQIGGKSCPLGKSKCDPAQCPIKGKRLGLVVDGLSDAMASQLPMLSGMGLITQRVAEGSAAAKAGIQPHDILFKFDDQYVANVDQLRKLIGMKPAGSRVKLTVVRGGKPVEVNAAFPPTAEQLKAAKDRERQREMARRKKDAGRSKDRSKADKAKADKAKADKAKADKAKADKAKAHKAKADKAKRDKARADKARADKAKADKAKADKAKAHKAKRDKARADAKAKRYKEIAAKKQATKAAAPKKPVKKPVKKAAAPKKS